MRKLFSFFALLLLAVNGLAQNVPAGFDLTNYGVRIDPDTRVILVLATLEAARTKNEAGESVPVLKTPLSDQGAQFRELLKSDLAALNEDLRQRISTFVIQHKKRNPDRSDAQIVAPFISMAYTLTPAPELADPVVTNDLPGSLLDVLDFSPLVRDFYRRSSISGNLGEYVKKYREVADGRLRASTREMVNDVLTYMHTRPQIFYEERIRTETQKTGSKKTTLANVETRSRERRFMVVPEMLAPAGTVNFVNIKDDYYVVVPPDTDVTFSDVRRAYLQFVIDPLVIARAADIGTIKDAVKKLLDDRRKLNPDISPDVYLTVSRSLVAAIDAKQIEKQRISIATAQARQRIAQMKTDDEKRAVSAELERLKRGFEDETALRLSEDYENGAILDFYFAEQLRGFEDSGFDIASSMREMILSIEPGKEPNRLEQYAEARKRALAAREERKRNAVASNVIIENPVTTRLIEIQKTIDAKNYDQAGTELKQLLEKHPSEARIFYNIGRVASLSAQSIENTEQQSTKLLEAKVAYENVIRTAAVQTVDPALVSLSYVALAKIYEFYDNKGYAMSIYDAAIKLGDVTGGAFKEAVTAKARLLKEQQ